MGSNTRTLLAQHGERGPLRLHALLQFDRNLSRLSNGCGQRRSASPDLKPGDPVQWGIPNVTLINYSGIGDSTEGPYANDNNTLQFVDNLSWIHGKHTFRFGGEFRRENYNQVGNQFARGQFTFQPNATQNPATKTGGDTFADFLLGDLYQSEAAVAIANAKFQRNAWSFYIRRHLEGHAEADARRWACVTSSLRRSNDTLAMPSPSTCPYVDRNAECAPTRAAIRSSSGRHLQR